MLLPAFSLTYGTLQVAYRSYFASIKGIAVLPSMSMQSAGVTIPYFVAAFILYGSLTILVDKRMAC